MNSLIIFDCDGTLVDSEGLHTAVTFALFNEILGREVYTPESHGEFFMGRSWRDICAMVAEEHAILMPEDIDARYIGNTTKAMEQPGMLEACPQAHDVVERLGQSHTLCVASNGERKNVLTALDMAGLLPYFAEDQIFTKNQVENPKPAPDLFLYACKAMGGEPRNTLVIEDSATGVKAGHAAGMKVLGFTGVAPDKKARSRELMQAGASDIIQKLSEIERHVWKPRPAFLRSPSF